MSTSEDAQGQCGAHSILHNYGDTGTNRVGYSRRYLGWRGKFMAAWADWKSCSVSPFSTSYDRLHDVHISNWLTAYNDQYVRIWILFQMKSSGLGQAWITHSLIQIKYKCWECQFLMTRLSRSWRLDISHKRVFIPFECVYFDSRVPTKCKII